MVALADIQQQLQLRNSTLKTTLSTFQHTLTSSVKLEEKEGDYVVLADMMENNPELKNIPAEMKGLQDDEAVLAQRAEETARALEMLEAELKKAPAEKAVLDGIKKELSALLIPKDCEAREFTLDNLLALAAKQMNKAEFKKKFNSVLKKEIRVNEKSVLIEDYIVLNKLASPHIPLLSPKGRALANHVFPEQQLGRLEQSVTADEEKAQQLNERVTQFQTRCVADLKKHADQAKIAAGKTFESIKKAKELLDEMEALKAQAENKLLAYLALDENANLDDFAREMAQTIDEIENGKGDGNSSKAEQATQLLTKASADCENNQKQFGQAAIWKRLPKKIIEQSARLDSLPEKLEKALQDLREQKILLDDRIEEKNRPAQNNEQVEPLPRNNNNAEAARYKTATDEYLGRLSGSIDKHLIMFKESAEKMPIDRYLYIASCLGLVHETEVSNVLPALKKAYRYGGDEKLQKEIDQALMPQNVDEQQESLRDTLHKYRLMTELSVAASESSEKFLGILGEQENKTLLARRRDSSFMLWAKSCGKAVAVILGVLDATYGRFFPPRGETFTKKFGRVVENIEPDEQARHSMSRSAGS